MYQTIIPFYPPDNSDPKKEYFATLNKDEDKHSKGAISHIVGSDEIKIRSTNNSYGAIPIEGMEHIKILRDALIKICDMKEFDSLFEELTGVKPENAKKEDGYLFIPPESNFHENDKYKKRRLSEIANASPKGNKQEGWWIRNPLDNIEEW